MNRQKTNAVSPMLLGRIPPQAVDVEEVVLGSLLLERNAIDIVINILKSESFYKEQHQIVYSAIISLYHQNSPIDLLTVTAELRKMGKLEEVGGAYFMTQLTDRVVSSVNLEFHAKLLSEKYIQRELIIVSSEVIEECYSGTVDVMETLTKNESKRDSLLNAMVSKKSVVNIELFDETIFTIESAKCHTNGVTGIQSGFSDLDRITSGWQKSELIILAARPAMGKSALALAFAFNATTLNNVAVGVFSLEMANIQLMQRLMSMGSGIDLKKFKTRDFTNEELNYLKKKRKELGEIPIIWDDTASLSVNEFKAKARKMKREFDIQLIVIDYLQLMDSGLDHKASRDQQIGAISRALKLIAKELEIPVIALSQLSRAVESRAGNNKRPMLQDLRESGNIEQDADMVMFLYRPEYYGLTENEDGRSTQGLAEVIIAKNRSGEIDDVEIGFTGRCTKFYDLAPVRAQEEMNEFLKNTAPTPNYVDYSISQNENKQDAPF